MICIFNFFLPFSHLKDLEETICTMKEQIVILKSRADILQEELQFTSTTTVTSATTIS